VGSIIELATLGNFGWSIGQPAGVSITFGNVATTVGTGGSLTSIAGVDDSIRLLCVVANTTWTVLSVQGNINYV
jgi:hypothetical protein